MGWFALACLVGFAISRASRALRVQPAGGMAILAVALFGAVVWALFTAPAPTFAYVTDTIGAGVLARFILGLIFGLLIGLVLQTGIPKTAYLWIAIVVALLALVAPHIDRWMSRATSVKASVVEIQLSRISAEVKNVKADKRESFANDEALGLLAEFPNVIEKDLAFISHFAIPNTEREPARNSTERSELEKQLGTLKTQERQLTQLHQFFKDIVAPLANCAKAAVMNGLDVESIRELLRPTANLLMQIVLLENEQISARQEVERLE